MLPDTKTNFGIIPSSELVIGAVPSVPAFPLHNFVNDLFVNEVDGLSAPLVAIFEDKDVKICQENFSFFDNAVFAGVKYFKAQGAKSVTLPKFLSPKLAYFVGYFLGDGSLKDINKTYSRFGRFEHKMKICDEFLVQVEIIQALFEGLFGLKLPIRLERVEKGERLYYVEITNKPIYRFLTQVFGFPSGSKTDFVEIPKIILGAPTEIKAWFLRGLFDAEGGTRAVEAGFNSQPRIKIKMKSKEFISALKPFFENVFKVSANGPYFEESSAYFQIERHSDIISLFNQKIFLHPIKRWRLDKTAAFLVQKIAARSRD